VAVNTQSLLLNGTTNALSMAEHADFDGSTWTSGAWLKTTSSGSTRVIMSNHERSATPIRYGWYWGVQSGGAIRISMGNGTNDTAIVYNDSTAINDGVWHWVVCTYDGSDMYVYIDGILSGSGSDGGATLTYGTTYPRVGCIFGNDTGTNSAFYPGNIYGAFYIKGTVWTATDCQTYMFQDLATALPTNLVAYYKFDGDLTDTSGSATTHNGTQIGTVAYDLEDVPWIGGANNSSLDLERGSSQMAEITDASQTGLDITGDITIEAWVKVESEPATSELRNIVSKASDTANQTQYYFDYYNNAGTKQIRFIYNDGANATYDTLNYTLVAGTWYHVAVVADVSATDIQFYVNGVNYAGTNVSNSATAIGAGDGPFIVGARKQTQEHFWDGLIDNVMVFSDIRTSGEIASDMWASDISDGNLVGHWKFESDYTDESGNGNTLTAVASPVFSGTVPFVDTSVSITATDSNRIEDINATTNYSANAYFQVGEWNGGSAVDRSLLHFDVSSIPATATINQVRLILWDDGSNYSSNTRTMRVYRMVRAWTASTSTWNTTDGSTSWGTAGASNATDREATDIGSVSMPATEIEGYWQVTLSPSNIQDWIDGDLTNNGLQLKMDTETNDMHQFSDETVSGEEPKLIVDYTVAGGLTLALMGVGK